MFKLFRLKLEKELAESKMIHEIAIKKKDAELILLEQKLRAEHELALKEAVTLLKLDSEQKISQIKLDYSKKTYASDRAKEQEFLKLKEDLLKENHDKFNQTISKIHEDGNVTTRFVQELAYKMMEKAPATKIETKLITKQEG